MPADDELWDDIDGFIQQVRDLAGEKLAIRRVGRDLEALGAAIDDLDMAAIDAPGSLDTSDVAAW